jgi:hypothetical protein
MLGEMVQDRQREGRGLAGAGLGDAAEVAAGHHVRDGLGLDRGGSFVAFGGERLLDRGGEAEVGEVGQGSCLSTDAMSPSPAGSARGAARAKARRDDPRDKGCLEDSD